MQIRLFRKEETAVLQSAIDRLWAKNHILSRDEQLLKYMFLHNPVNQSVIGSDDYGFVGAWHNDDVIGLFGLMYFNFNVKGQIKLGCTPTNWIVPPEYRQTGAGLAMMREMFRRNPAFVLNLGINQNVAQLYSRMGGYSVLPDMPRWIGIVNKELTTELLLLGDKSYLRYWNEIKPIRTNSNNRICFELDKEKWDQWYWSTFAKRSVGFVRDYSFILWRYIQHPSFNYKVILATDANGNYSGLMVIRIEEILNQTARIGRIVEFMANDQDSSVCLANYLVEFGKELLFFDFYCFSSISSWGLETIGFKRVHKNDKDKLVVPTRFQPLDLEITYLMAAAYVSKDLLREINLIDDQMWYITKGDADQDRPN